VTGEEPAAGDGPLGCLAFGPACLAWAGDRIRAARERAGLGQLELAGVLGVTQAGVSAWESGKRDPGIAGLVRIAWALGVPVESLLPASEEDLRGTAEDLRRERSSEREAGVLAAHRGGHLVLGGWER
jgi:uncharacterized protein